MVGWRLAALLSLGPLLAACAIRQASPEGITIEHNAYHPWLAAIRADRHCARYDRKAVLIETTEPAPSADLMHMNSSRSVFECASEADDGQAPAL